MTGVGLMVRVMGLGSSRHEFKSCLPNLQICRILPVLNKTNSEAMNLAKAAEIISELLLKKQQNFERSFRSECHENSVPKVQLALINMIRDGPYIKDQTKHQGGGVTNASIILSKLLIFNVVRHTRSAAAAVSWHSVNTTLTFCRPTGPSIFPSLSRVDNLCRKGLPIYMTWPCGYRLMVTRQRLGQST